MKSSPVVGEWSSGPWMAMRLRLAVKDRVESGGLKSCILLLFEVWTDYADIENRVITVALQTVHGTVIL